ncbi:glycosyltransferase [Rugamonas apoptosis]|nr:glycosyltransferase [Rugamonas apoptosis]
MRGLDRIVVKGVLMVAFHYPPMRGSSGIQRTLKFAQYLPRSDWQPVVLSAHPRAYPDTSTDQLTDTCAGPPVWRSAAWDAARHLAIRGRYPALLAQPDRWISWWLSAVPAGLRLIRRHRPSIIWSSYPIATAHLVALTLHRLTGLPWVADQRDPLTEPGYPADPRTHRIHQWIEAQAASRGAAIVCTTPGAMRACQERHSTLADGRLRLIENGYDEDNFRDATASVRPQREGGGQFRLLHSGLVYPSERDPRPLFAALRRLRASGEIEADNFRLVLRAHGHEDFLRPLIARDQIEALVELAPPLPYQHALAEMLAADGLLLLQAANCNHQIPAKLYEYLRAGRPLLALTDPAGDTAATLRGAGIDTIARLDSEADIAMALSRFLRLARHGVAPLAHPDTIASHSRAARTLELAALFDEIATRGNK